MPTQKVTLTAGVWTQLPTATKFLCQNAGEHVIVIQATASQPASTDTFGHRLQPRLSMSNLSSENHWAFCSQPCVMAFTPNDL